MLAGRLLSPHATLVRSRLAARCRCSSCLHAHIALRLYEHHAARRRAEPNRSRALEAFAAVFHPNPLVLQLVPKSPDLFELEVLRSSRCTCASSRALHPHPALAASRAVMVPAHGVLLRNHALLENTRAADDAYAKSERFIISASFSALSSLSSMSRALVLRGMQVPGGRVAWKS